MSSKKIWVERDIAKLLDSAVNDAEAVHHSLDRHLCKLGKIAQMFAEDKIKTQEDLAKVAAAILRSAQALDAAKAALRNRGQHLY